MNPCMPDWNFEADLPFGNKMKPMGPENEFVELLWRNGQVVLQSQTYRRPSLNPTEPRQVQKQTIRGSSSSHGNSSNLIQDDETVSWIQNPLEDSLEKEFYSNFFSDLPPSGPMEVDKHTRQLEEEKSVKFDAPSVVTSIQQLNVNQLAVTGLQKRTIPPPRFEFHDVVQQNKSLSDLGTVDNFSQSTTALNSEIGSSKGQFDQKVSGNLTQGEVRVCSMMTVRSSHCGSNRIAYDIDVSRASSNGVGTTSSTPGNLKDDVRKVISQSERGKTETLELTDTSYSGGSGSTVNRTSKQSTGEDKNLKRKSRDAGESECQSEAVEFESAPGNKTEQRSGSCRRNRAAEVHNLSERRRRDKINEKMRALQELIPHCNKTDKASMLDEAIEYLKSLQLQLQMYQVMWMGSRMAPMMFPGVQHYVSPLGMGMCPPALPSITNPMHMPRIPLVDQSLAMAQAQNQAVICQTPVLNPVNYQNQMQNSKFPDQYARYMGFQSMQTNSQPINMFRFGSPIMQSQVVSQPNSNCGPFPGGAASDNAPTSGKTG